MPPKNITSVMRKIHIPREEASFCCSAVLNCSRNASVSTWGSLTNLTLLADRRAVVVGVVRDDRDLVEIVRGWRRIRLPFEAGGLPRVPSRNRPVLERPHEVHQRH